MRSRKFITQLITRRISITKYKGRQLPRIDVARGKPMKLAKAPIPLLALRTLIAVAFLSDGNQRPINVTALM